MNQIQEFLQYILQSVKFWVIVQPWQTALIVRFGKRVKKVEKGVYFKIPYFDSVYIQESRLRVTPLSMQTLTTKDLKTITLNGSVGYSIESIEDLYKTLYHPETTIANIVMSEISDFIYSKDLDEITPKELQEKVFDMLNTHQYGLRFEYFKITNFAVVRTYRLIQDQSWTDETLRMDESK